MHKTSLNKYKKLKPFPANYFCASANGVSHINKICVANPIKAKTGLIFISQHKNPEVTQNA